MSAMSASPPVGLPLSLIAEHKVAASKPPPAVPASTPQPVAALAPLATAPPAVAPQPQTNGMEPAQSPPTPAIAPPTGPPPVPASPPPPQPTISVNTAQNNAQAGISQAEGGPVAPGSGTSTSGGSGEVEGNSAAVGDVPPAEDQPCVPPTPATVPAAETPQEHVAAVPAPAVALPAPEAPSPSSLNQVLPPGPAPAAPHVSLPPAPIEASPPPTSAPAALPPTSAPAPSMSAAPPQEKAKPSRPRKRKVVDGEPSKKSQKIEETAASLDDGRKSKRARLPTQPYQSPIPELNLIAKMNNTPKSSEEKLIVFYRNEFLAVRNAEGGFYVCQAMQNIYRSPPGHRSKIKIRWFSQGANDVFTPDFYDSTEFDCILTNLNLDRIEKDKYKLPTVEKQRTESILKRAIDAEKGVAQPTDSALTEEHPDGLDLSLYRHEDQLKKRRKKSGSSKKKAKAAKVPAEVKKPTRTSARNNSLTLTDEVVPPIKGKILKLNEKVKPRGTKKRKALKKGEKAKKKEPEIIISKKEVVENNGRKISTNSGAQPKKNSDKTKSAVGAKAGSKAPPGNLKQPAATTFSARQTRQAIPKQ